MLKQFQKFIRQNKLDQKSDKVLIACSGGMDSMVLTDLFLKSGFSVALAHCNFQLRGKDAAADEKFVISFAKKNKLQVHTQKFDTKKYASQNKMSIQVAARTLRYEWFEELRTTNDYQFIATAHHQTDLLETMLINLIRGTGLAGLHGILPKQNQLIRPLLFAGRKTIEQYCSDNYIEWREDLSNNDDHYVRNKIRHHILPVLREINPSVENTFYENALRFYASEKLIDSFSKNILEKIKNRKNETDYIDIAELLKNKSSDALLYLAIKDYGFNSDAVKQIFEALDKQSGKRFFSSTHELVLDRNQLIVTTLSSESNQEIYVVEEMMPEFSTKFFSLKFELISNSKNSLKNITPDIALFDASAIKFPLTLRKWHSGDYFFPLGMNGKRKKLSDFFTDKKISIPDKKNCFLMLSENNIVWVMNLRTDERFKVTRETKLILKCIYIKK